MTGRLYRVDPARSKAGFCVRHFPFQEFRGEFTSLVGGLAFPPDHARAGQALLLIKTTAMQSDDNDLLPMVEGQDFMDTGRFPDILFVGRSVELFSEERGRVRGELTLHGITQPVVFDIDLYVLEGGGGRLPDRILLKGKSEVNRMSFDINSYRYFVSETVRLCLSVELVPFDH